MFARLSSQQFPALAALRTRDADDFSIALLDAWATVADVLTFYQERIANENYLRTATERQSLLEQARLIGYELRPGVAASTFLAFTLEAAPGSPRRTTIAAAGKCKASPAPTKNRKRSKRSKRLKPASNGTPAAQAQPVGQSGFWQHARLPERNRHESQAGGRPPVCRRGARKKPRQRAVGLPAHDGGDSRPRCRSHARGMGRRTGHDDAAQGRAGSQSASLRAAQRASLFGHNAPHPATLAFDTLYHYKQRPADDWNFAFAGQTIDLDTTYPAILLKSWLVLSRPDYQELYRATAVTEASRQDFTLTGKTTRITLDTNENLHRFQGANYRNTMAFAQSEPLTIAEEPIVEPITGKSIPLVQPPQGLVPGQRLAASGKDSVTGEPIGEVVAVASVSDTTLTVTPGLSLSYRRDSFAFNANVARGTHGETVEKSWAAATPAGHFSGLSCGSRR